MQVTYTTTIDDFVAFNRCGLRKSRVARAVFLFAWAGLPTLGVIGAALLAVGEGLSRTVFCVGASSLVFAALWPLVHGRYVDRFVRAYARQMGTRGLLGRTTLMLTEETLVEITETTRSEVRWKDVHAVETVGDHTFIFVTGLTAAIVPRHGFGESAEYEAVREFALARVAQKTT